MSNTFDLIILGGGCAGLSLASRLAIAAPDSFKTLVVEARTRYVNDRTWCFWGTDSASSVHPIQHRWSRMRLTSGTRTVFVDCGPTPYQMLLSEAFYSASLSTISAAKNTSLKLNATVRRDPQKIGGFWEVETDAGVFSGRAIVDTRPQRAPARDGALLWQSFYGKEIECDKAVFDPSCMDLMNFLPSDHVCIPFVYVLPTTPTKALVELTVFGVDPLQPEDLAFKLDAAIAQRTKKGSFRVLRSEHGVLPMGLPAHGASADQSYVRAGVMAGGARPSTGFAFQRIQRWADVCARSIVGGVLPLRHEPDPVVLQIMDDLFLKVLRASPDKAGDMFCSLFGNVSTSRVIRFLNGDGGWLDHAAVISALPFSPFIKLLAQSRTRQSRSQSTERSV